MSSQFFTEHSNITGQPEFPSCYSDMTTMSHSSTELNSDNAGFSSFQELSTLVLTASLHKYYVARNY